MSKPSDFPLPKNDGSIGFWTDAAPLQRPATIIDCICDNPVTMPDGYGDQVTCENCGSFFDYDEGFAVRLSDEQIKSLMKHKEEWIKKD